jgi:type VI secretion system secreted protein VgrG
VVSANAAVEIQAKQTVHLAVSGGAHLTIEGGKIVFGCPGKITVYAARHDLDEPTLLSWAMNTWREPAFDERVRLHFPDGCVAANQRFEWTRADGATIRGTTDADGWASLQYSSGLENVVITWIGKA